LANKALADGRKAALENAPKFQAKIWDVQSANNVLIQDSAKRSEVPRQLKSPTLQAASGDTVSVEALRGSNVVLSVYFPTDPKIAGYDKYMLTLADLAGKQGVPVRFLLVVLDISPNQLRPLIKQNGLRSQVWHVAEGAPKFIDRALDGVGADGQKVWRLYTPMARCLR
jgi:hypothetical protein